jgi:hypothetical protein
MLMPGDDSGRDGLGQPHFPCTFFRPPGSCTVVSGTNSPQGWCKFFDLSD